MLAQHNKFVRIHHLGKVVERSAWKQKGLERLFGEICLLQPVDLCIFYKGGSGADLLIVSYHKHLLAAQ